ncbi:MAG: Ldh family oxidoreductase [Armatimonadetes bacterium]|nr:Ldh family oxidoreductase [Armatimonadota bacterium]
MEVRIPPNEVAARVRPEALRRFLADVGRAVGMSEEDTVLLAMLLARNDLRGVHSHGSRQIVGYAHWIRKGNLNPRPVLREHSRTASSVIVDGDGGLGYFPAWRAVHLLVEMTKAQGIAVAGTHNHGHIGAAGLYSRVPASHGLICYGTSGYQQNPEPGTPLSVAAGGSPMTFAIPAGAEHPVVLDFGTMNGLYSRDIQDRVFEVAPGALRRCIGLGVMCQILGGILVGVPIAPAEAPWKYPGAFQGALFIAVDVGRFMPVEAFAAQIDEYVRRAGALQPLPGQERAHLPGGPEWENEREYARDGIPFTRKTLDQLAATGRELGVALLPEME